MFLLFPIYVTPLAYIIFTIVCQRYKYEVIFIDAKQIRFSSSYTKKNSKTSMTSFFKIENLKEFKVIVTLNPFYMLSIFYSFINLN